MTARVYYNEFDPFAAAWLRELMKAGLIPEGDVDERSIVDVLPSDLKGYTRCNFFAGVGGWELALRLANWPDDAEIWTGSCPCQPFSMAGKRRGEADERHLWPVFFGLIRECRPAVVIGEQVSAARTVVPEGVDLQEVRDREAVFGLLREFQRGHPPRFLQELHSGTFPETQEEVSGSDQGYNAPVAAESPREGTYERSEAQSQSARSALRSGPYRDTEACGHGNMRTDRDTVFPDGAESLERTILGSGRLVKGIHEREHSRRALLRECDDEYMGGEQDFADCVGDFSTEIGRERAFASIIDGLAQATTLDSWLAGVRSDMDRIGYEFGAADLCAAGVGAPHVRQRLYWVADANRAGQCAVAGPICDIRDHIGRRGEVSDGLGDATGAGFEQRRAVAQIRGDNAFCGFTEPGQIADWNGPTRLIECSDGPRRIPVEPALFPLASGISNRVGALRGSGNAIVPQVAAEFVKAFMETRE